ncbi:hypothetical protein, partial [Paracraurococcus ruber]
MGLLIDPHEIYFNHFINGFNQRFGPAHPAPEPAWVANAAAVAGPARAALAGGIAEIAALQREFGIFRPGRSFLQSVALLGLTGALHGAAKERWLEYLAKLPRMQSNNPRETGEERIVNALVANFDRKDGPLPCYMQAHDGRTLEPGLVVVSEGTPLFYLEGQRFLTICLPMRPSGGPGVATGLRPAGSPAAAA